MILTQNGFFITGLIYMVCYQFLSKRETIDSIFVRNKEKYNDKDAEFLNVIERFGSALKFGVSAIELITTLIPFALAFIYLPLGFAISVVLLVRVLLKDKKETSYYLRDWIMANYPLLLLTFLSIF